MHDAGGSIQISDIDRIVTSRVELTDWEKEVNEKTNVPRWRTHTLFSSISYSYAGLFIKKRGTWYITDEGENALKRGADEIWEECGKLYAERHSSNENCNNDSYDESGEDVITNDEIILGIEELEAKAYEEIRLYIKQKNPYEFQDMVAALLRAMGYYTPFVAPRGKDGGIDIIAYVDAIGAKSPRIKIQVKHYPDNPVGAHDIRSLRGLLRDDEIGLFVTSGRYSNDAKTDARLGNKYIKLIDGEELITLWQLHYDRMNDEDKNILPLYRISFLGNK